MSDPASWAERSAPFTGVRRQPAAAIATEAMSGPELVVNHQAPDANPFVDHREYVAVAGVMGRSTHDTCFIADDGVPHFKPWAYCQGYAGHPAHRGITLHWPGCRVEVAGENLQLIYPLMMIRHAGIWRVFDAARHAPPTAGATVIRSIRVIVTEDMQTR